MTVAANHKDIIEACKRNDRQAQFELYRLYSKAMYNIALRMVRDGSEANDMLQNSFVDVFKNLDSFRYQSSFGAWMKRIVINNCINHLRKKKLDLIELQEGYHDRYEEPETLPKGLSVEAVKKAMKQLPEGYRVVFSLYAMEGYDHGEIAEILNVSESTSKSQYSRAKMKLRQILESDAFVNK